VGALRCTVAEPWARETSPHTCSGRHQQERRRATCQRCASGRPAGTMVPDAGRHWAGGAQLSICSRRPRCACGVGLSALGTTSPAQSRSRAQKKPKVMAFCELVTSSQAGCQKPLKYRLRRTNRLDDLGRRWRPRHARTRHTARVGRLEGSAQARAVPSAPAPTRGAAPDGVPRPRSRRSGSTLLHANE